MLMTNKTQAGDAPAEEMELQEGDAEDAALWAEFEDAENKSHGAEGQDDDPKQEEQAAAKSGEDMEAAPRDKQEQAAEEFDRAALDPAVRAILEKVERERDDAHHRINSDSGRVSALQRRINDLEAATRKAAGKGGDNGTDTEDESIRELREAYPDIAEPVAKMIDPLRAENEDLRKRLAAIDAQQERDRLSGQETILAGQHPDWEQVTGNPAFVAWVRNQPEYVQQAAVRNAEEIVNGMEAAHIIASFKAMGGYEASQTPPEKGAPETPKASADPRRQAQLSSSAQPRPKGPAKVVDGLPDENDEDAAWRYYEKLDKQKARGTA